MIFGLGGVERRLRSATRQLARIRAELAQIGEQLVVVSDEADDAATRALVSDSPSAVEVGEQAQRHAAALRRSRDALRQDAARLEGVIDALLDRRSSAIQRKGGS